MSASLTGWSFQYSLPAASMPRVMVSGFSGAGLDCAVGRSSFRAWVNMGAVMMKITSRTSITSTIGVTLMSAIGAEFWLSLNPPKLMWDSSRIGCRKNYLRMPPTRSPVVRYACRSCAKPSSSASTTRLMRVKAL